MSSSHENKEPTPLQAVATQDLRLGMYIHLNCSWFLHPFSRQHFQLTSDSQIAAIRGLGLSSILLDPSQSTAESLDDLCPHAPPKDAGLLSRATSQEWTDSPQSAGSMPFQSALHLAARTYEDAARHFKQAIQGLHAWSEEGVAAAKQVTNQLAHILFDKDLAGSIAGLLDSSLMKERDVLHALNTSVLAMMIGQQFRLSVEDIKILGIGALLHDIGEHQLPDDLRTRRDRLTPDEERSYREHPALAVALLSPLSSFPQEALRMIESHHERIDGTGYPNQLQEEYLSLFTKILMVVDEYDVLINHDDPHQRLTAADALSHLYRTGRSKLAPDVIAALIQTLTVYPPGTIVELVNGAYALVLNINRRARMRPLVLLYVPQADNNAPTIIDLMRDRSRSIVHRPPLSGVPLRIRQYLNMDRWMPYFLATADEGTVPAVKSAQIIDKRYR